MEEKDKIIYVSVDDIIPNRFQPRLAFDEKELNSLSESIKKYGVIQPIVLRKIGEKYEIIAGERRYKASLLAGLAKIPAIINQTDDNTSAEIALLENLQRKNLTVIEESQSYKKLLDRGFTQEEIANKLGISQSSIANKLRLLNLPKEVQEALLYNKISERHARSLLSLGDKETQIELLNKIVNEKLTVKQTEEEISNILNKNIDLNNNINKIETTPSNDMNKPVQEYLDVKVPEVISIGQDNNIDNSNQTEIKKIENDSLSINPFQENFIEKLREIKRMDNYEPIPEIESKIEQLELENKPSNIEEQENISNIDDIIEFKEENINEVKQISLPKTIEKIRNLITELNSEQNIISTSEVDLSDKYQIIIDIKKE